MSFIAGNVRTGTGKIKLSPKIIIWQKKLEEAENLQTSRKLTALPSQTQKSPVLPMEVIETEYGIKPAIVIQYLVTQVISHAKERNREFP